MPTSEGRKRLEPRMARGSWRLAAWGAGGQAVCSALLTLNKLWPDNGWDAASFWIYLAWFAVSANFFLHLLRSGGMTGPSGMRKRPAEPTGTVGEGSCNPPPQLRGWRGALMRPDRA